MMIKLLIKYQKSIERQQIMKKTYVIIGLGNRSSLFLNGIFDYREEAELVGLCDKNAGRLALKMSWAKGKGFNPKGYSELQFDQMIKELKPDIVLVSTMDSTHHDYICRAMELGCDVVTEKPMTTDIEKCKKIFAMQKKTGKNCRVTFNYRYAPARTQVKQMLLDGVIGEVLSIDFNWMLNTDHGADYFRRWHRNKINSGGLMVHKSTHHFDLVNWWINSTPKKVYASGARKFYTPENGDKLGLTNRSERCFDCPDKKKCPFFFDISKAEFHRTAYLECEKHDGYIRDQCIFSSKIDIEDIMNVAVEYQNGVQMSYSLNAFCGWEGYQISFNGTKGRLEHKCQESVYVSGEGKVEGESMKNGTFTRVFPIKASPYNVEIWEAKGGHGGGDVLLQKDLFSLEKPADPFALRANHISGAKSILTGIAANLSMKENRPIFVSEFGLTLE